MACADDRPKKDKNGILLFRSLQSKTKNSPKLYEGERYSGPIVKYYKDGTLEFKGQYKNGVKYGAWKYYHPNGKLKREETAQPSQGAYEVKTYRSRSGILLTELIGKGEDTIHFKKYHHNGKLGQELQNNGTRIFQKWTSFGNLYHYHNEDSITITLNTKTREITHKGFYDDGKKVGVWFQLHSNGNKAYEKNYKSGKLHGKFIEYFQNGRKSLVKNYKLGKLVGKFIEYFENGNAVLESNYDENGNFDGTYKQYYKDGSVLLAGQYKKGGKTGTWNYYNEKGKLLEVENYKFNRLHGFYEYYYANTGQIREKGEYKNGRKVGIWYFYDITGNLREEIDEGD
jgi:antitoxin component YwqK of YwqJK toxin-antitoxin module